MKTPKFSSLEYAFQLDKQLIIWYNKIKLNEKKRLKVLQSTTWYMEGKKTILPHLTIIVINIIYNNGVHLGHFEILENEGSRCL